jgi:NADPH:quinone reductase-like Zn-dependent oxidoreductase
MIQCYTTNSQGIDGLHLVERPNPDSPGPDEVLVDVKAVSLNYRDLLVAEGKYGNEKYDPFIAASDMAGCVASVGANVTEFMPGDRVLNATFRFWPAGQLRSSWARTLVGGSGNDGVLAERIIYPAASLVRVPEHMTYEEGSTLTIAGLTAWAGMVTHGKTKPGEWVLLHGTGGVSIFAAQIAQILGARTILSTSSPEKGRLVKQELGVSEVIDYRDEGWPHLVKELTDGKGVDVVVDTSGGDTLSRTIKCCGYGARVGVIGVLDGYESSISIIDMILHQISVRGIYVESTEELRLFAQAMEVSRVHPYIDKVFPFEQARDAYEYLRSQQHIGKVVIRMNS